VPYISLAPKESLKVPPGDPIMAIRRQQMFIMHPPIKNIGNI
jgi:hypothetical protein